MLEVTSNEKSSEVLNFVMEQAKKDMMLVPLIKIHSVLIYSNSIMIDRWYAEAAIEHIGLQCTTWMLYRVWRNEEGTLHAIPIGQA